MRTAWSLDRRHRRAGRGRRAGRLLRPGRRARGARRAPGVQLGILETARGGMLLKGMGVTANDVSVVTNVSADHLGHAGHRHRRPARRGQGHRHQGHPARAAGWCSTARTRGCGRCAAASRPSRGSSRCARTPRPSARRSTWAVGRSPSSTARVTVLENGQDPDRLVSILDVPATLSGLSHHNIANALAGAAAALGLGLAARGRRRGAAHLRPRRRAQPRPDEHLHAAPRRRRGHHRHRRPGPQRGRPRGADGRRPRPARCPAARCTSGSGLAGDRTDELLESIGEIAGLRADRDRRGAQGALPARAHDGGARGAPATRAWRGPASPTSTSYETELGGLQALVPGAADGDVVALMCHAERAPGGRLAGRAGRHRRHARRHPPQGGRGPGRARVRGRRSPRCGSSPTTRSGSTPVAAAAQPSARPTRGWSSSTPSALDAAGKEQDAIPLYRESLAAGLREPQRHRARIQLASSLRSRPGSPSWPTRCSTELSARASGQRRRGGLPRPGRRRQRARRGVASPTCIEVLLHHAGDEDALAYQRALSAYAAELRDR